MESNEANKIPLEDILANYNSRPVKRYHSYDMYCSPFRDEKSPSFKVDKVHNRWNDFGSGEYGSAVDLVMKLEKCSFLESMHIFESKGFNSDFSFESLERKQREEEKPHSELILLKTTALSNKILLNYLKSRGIDEAISQKYCKEIYYKIGENGKNCFAVAFENNSGGIEFRNPLFKGCAITKDMTTIDNGHKKCAVFEGFIDFLSYMQIMKEKPENQKIDFVILNSATMLERSFDFLKKHEVIHAFLDNDQAGKNALSKLKTAGFKVCNEAEINYPNHKDLNERWMSNLKLSNAPIKKKEMRESRPINKPVLKMRH